MPEVRIAGAGDAGNVAKQLHDFNAEFGTPSPPVAELERRFGALLLRNDVLVIVAEDQGFALLTLRPTPYWDGPLAQLEELYLVPGRRGRGIGGAIMELAIAECIARGCEEMHINVDEPDEGARRFYERLGFSNFEVGEDYRMLCYIRER